VEDDDDGGGGGGAHENVFGGGGGGGVSAVAEGAVELHAPRELRLAVPVAGSAAPVEVRVRVQTRGAERGAAGGAGTLTLVSVPYSEHSSFGELRRCVAALRAERIVPTVNCRSQADLARIVALLS
jgi:hypothetical protein